MNVFRVCCAWWCGVFPAYAGVNRPAASAAHLPPSVPRIRGGEPIRLHDPREVDGFPAYAGVNPFSATTQAVATSVPRMSGGEP